MYNRLSDYYKKKYGEAVKKICIDGGFTCPNRDGSKGVGGCIFCNQQGSGEQILYRKSVIKCQIDNEINLRGEGKYIAYYQNFSNTYDSIEELEKKYSPALSNDKIVALYIGTRPDCINEQNVKLLKQLSAKKEIVVELGLQTSSEITAIQINRCYKSCEFTTAVQLLNKYDIEIIVHIILGLPSETIKQVKDTVSFLNKHNYHAIKIHSLYVSSGTALATMFSGGQYQPISLENYISQVVYVLTHISPSIIIHRITGDGDKATMLAPAWSKNKIRVINAINKHLIDNKLRQGSFY